MRDPERPYAQLLTPAAKSQKLLLRLQHKKLLPKDYIVRSQAVFTLWQKLLAKNIPSTPWPYFADLILYPEERYLALRLWPFGDLTPLQEAYQARYIDGYLLVDPREEAPPVAVEGQKLVAALSLADRLGQRLWQWLGQELTAWQTQVVLSLPQIDADGALDLLGMLRQYDHPLWPEAASNGPQFAEQAKAFFLLWRARGQEISARRLAEQGVLDAASWLASSCGQVIATEKGFALRS